MCFLLILLHFPLLGLYPLLLTHRSLLVYRTRLDYKLFVGVDKNPRDEQWRGDAGTTAVGAGLRFLLDNLTRHVLADLHGARVVLAAPARVLVIFYFDARMRIDFARIRISFVRFALRWN